jgi:AraC-like DNA-binding protein
MKDFLPVDYSMLVPNELMVQSTQSQAEFIAHEAINTDWGMMTVSSMSLPEIHLVKFDAQIARNLNLQKRDGQGSTVDTCIFLDGTIETDFFGLEERVVMRKGMQNFIYQPDTVADHYVCAQEALKILHVSVERSYFAELLCEDEKWSAELKEKLQNKELICGSSDNLLMTPQMLYVVNDILNCPLRGNLKNLVIEAKVIEFIALQLNQLEKECHSNKTKKLNQADRDAFYALREFLHQTFTGDHSLKNLARSFGLNEFKLKKGFKELFGCTVFEYLHDLKMEHAKQLLLDESVYINEVSGLVGYKNPNHFSTAFKKKYGMNPNSLRA